MPQTDFLQTIPSLYKFKNKSLLNFTWVGWPDFISKNVEEKLKITEMLAKINCVPIWISEDNILKYQLFIQKFLVPMLNNFTVP